MSIYRVLLLIALGQLGFYSEPAPAGTPDDENRIAAQGHGEPLTLHCFSSKEFATRSASSFEDA